MSDTYNLAGLTQRTKNISSWRLREL